GGGPGGTSAKAVEPRPTAVAKLSVTMSRCIGREHTTAKPTPASRAARVAGDDDAASHRAGDGHARQRGRAAELRARAAAGQRRRASRVARASAGRGRAVVRASLSRLLQEW